MSVVDSIIDTMAQLTDHETKVLLFAEARSSGSKAHTIEVFGWRETTYVIELRKLISRADVQADPRWTMLAHRELHRAERLVRARRSRTFAPRVPHGLAG